MSDKKRIIVNVVEPVLRETLPRLAIATDSKRSELAKTAALVSLARLENQGMKKEEVLKEFSKESLMLFVDAYKLPEAIKPWFELYYKYMETLDPVKDALPA